MSPKKTATKAARPRVEDPRVEDRHVEPLRAVVLVDAPRLVKLLQMIEGVAVVDVTRPRASPAGDAKGSPSGQLAERIAAAVRARRETSPGWMPPVLYLHDAATVLYPFAIEPLATLLAMHDEEVEGPFPYRDLGLAPLGTSARRFSSSASPDALGDEPVRELASIPDAALVAYVTRALAG